MAASTTTTSVVAALMGAVIGATLGLAVLQANPVALYAPAGTTTTTSAAVAPAWRPAPVGPIRPTMRANAMNAESGAPIVPAATQSAASTLPAALGALALIGFGIAAYLRRPAVAMAGTTGEWDVEAVIDRRRALGGMVAAAGLAVGSPAFAAASQAQKAEQAYREDTLKLVAQIRSVLLLQKGDETMPGKVAELRDAMKEWLAQYRRDDRFEGRASYGAVYTAVNIIAGHYVSVGNTVPLPAKRSDLILKNIANAEQLLPKGR